MPGVSPKVIQERPHKLVPVPNDHRPRAEGAPDVSIRNVELPLFRAVHAREAVPKVGPRG